MKDLSKQFKVFFLMILNPEAAFKAIPKHNFYVVGGLINGYFTFIRLQRQDYYLPSETTFMTRVVAFFGVFLISLIGLWITASILRWIVKLFKKDLTRTSIMNLIGYAQSRRLLLFLPAGIIMLLMPTSPLATTVLNYAPGAEDSLTRFFFTFNLVLYIDSLRLLISGLMAMPE